MPTSRQCGIALISAIALLAIVIVAGLVWSQQSKKAAREKAAAEFKVQFDQLVALDSRWVDALKLAASTSRIGLANPVHEMQTIRQEAETLPLTPCLDMARKDFVTGAESFIEGFMQFMQQESESTVAASMESGKTFIETYRAALTTCKKQAAK